jgi:hypothetical protein
MPACRSPPRVDWPQPYGSLRQPDPEASPAVESPIEGDRQFQIMLNQ